MQEFDTVAVKTEEGEEDEDEDGALTDTVKEEPEEGEATASIKPEVPVPDESEPVIGRGMAGTISFLRQQGMLPTNTDPSLAIVKPNNGNTMPGSPPDDLKKSNVKLLAQPRAPQALLSINLLAKTSTAIASSKRLVSHKTVSEITSPMSRLSITTNLGAIWIKRRPGSISRTFSTVKSQERRRWRRG